MALSLDLHVSMIVKESVWLNRTLYLERDDDGALQTTLEYSETRCHGKLDVTAALMFFAAMHNEHYDTLGTAATRMEDTARLLKTPMQLWRTERGRYFFAHATLNAKLFNCEVVAV